MGGSERHVPNQGSKQAGRDVGREEEQVKHDIREAIKIVAPLLREEDPEEGTKEEVHIQVQLARDTKVLRSAAILQKVKF